MAPDPAAKPGGPDRAAEFALLVKGRPLPGGDWVAKGGSSREVATLQAAVAPEGGLALSLGAHPLRLLHPVRMPGDGQDLELRWFVHGLACVEATLVARTPEGRWRGAVSARFAAGEARLAVPAALSDEMLALSIDLPAGAKVTLGPLRHGAVPPVPVPARRSAAPNMLRVSAVNDAFAGLAAADPLAAMRAQMDACRRLGLFDRVAALHDAMTARDPGIVWSEAELRGLCQAWTALGEGARLRATLAAMTGSAAVEDEVAAMRARLAVADGASPFTYGWLPSGAPDHALAAAHPDLAAALAPPAPVTSADWLLVANAWAGRDEARWVTGLAGCLAAWGLPGLALRPGAEAPLLRLQAPPPPPVPVGGHPRVSILLSAWCAEATVQRAIDSILESSLRDVEVLACDDASPDATLARLRGYVGHPRVRVFRSLANQGTYNIRNALLAHAGGVLVGFQDSDDWSHPLRLEHQLRAMEGGAAVVTGHLRLRLDGGVVVFANGRAERIAPVTCLAPRDACLAAGPFRSVSVGADTEWLDRLRELRGAAAVVELPAPYLLAAWGSEALTRIAASAQTEDGFVAPARRAYREALVLRRLLGAAVMDDAAIGQVTRRAGLHREPSSIEEFRGA
jgi:hypothetical protein